MQPQELSDEGLDEAFDGSLRQQGRDRGPRLDDPRIVLRASSVAIGIAAGTAARASHQHRQHGIRLPRHERIPSCLVVHRARQDCTHEARHVNQSLHGHGLQDARIRRQDGIHDRGQNARYLRSEQLRQRPYRGDATHQGRAMRFIHLHRVLLNDGGDVGQCGGNRDGGIGPRGLANSSQALHQSAHGGRSRIRERVLDLYHGYQFGHAFRVSHGQ
mmetsp:Transcript_20837/g.43494  ORF Transcript_20837/g.43494 Transcript_20837/m.43494 type:complete len:216 (-) Transcript_20837:352-999(-)